MSTDNQDKILAYLKEVCNTENFESSNVNFRGTSSEVQKIIFKKDNKCVEFSVEMMPNADLRIDEVKLIGDNNDVTFDYKEIGNFFGGFNRPWCQFHVYLKSTLLPKYNANVVGIHKKVDDFLKSEEL